VHLFIFFGAFLLPAVALVVDAWWRTRGAGPAGGFGVLAALVPVALSLAWAVAILVAVAVNLVPEDQLPAIISPTAKPLHLVLYTLVTLGVLWVALRVVYRLRDENGNISSDWFVLVLIALAAVLFLVCETFYIRDVFNSRMNTVFKFYYQIWVLLAVAAAYGLYAIPRRWPRWAGGSVSAVAGVLILAALCYPLLAVPTKTGNFQLQPTLDGIAWMTGPFPGDLQAIHWLNEHVDGAPVILETVGGEWGDYSHISAMTGLPTVMGWAGHEWQWRGEYPGQRESDVKAIYEGDTATAQALLDQYDVTYVYVGTLERQDYTPETLAKFDTFMDVVYDADGVTIYKRR
jgi:YYY domain-containing protein